MLLRLIVKFFFYNRKRTYRAIAILSVGIIIVLATNMLIGGFYAEVESFSSSVERSTIDYVITSREDDFSIIEDSAFTKIHQILRDSIEVDYFIPYLSYPTNVIINNASYGWFDLSIINTSLALEVGRFFLRTSIDKELPIINEKLDIPTNILGLNYSFLFDDTTIKSNYSNSFIESSFYLHDIIIDQNSSLVPINLRNKWNTVELRFKSQSEFIDVIEELQAINSIKISQQRSDLDFLKDTSLQIGLILSMLQIGLSVILIISISYVMLALVNDSKQEVKIMGMIGLNNKQIIMIFVGQALLVGIISLFLSIIFTIILLNIILSLFASTSIFPFVTIKIDNAIFLSSFFQAIIVSLGASIFPSIRVISE